VEINPFDSKIMEDYTCPTCKELEEKCLLQTGEKYEAHEEIITIMEDALNSQVFVKEKQEMKSMICEEVSRSIKWQEVIKEEFLTLKHCEIRNLEE